MDTNCRPQFEGLRWLFFDLDDTLWDFSANSLHTLRGLYATEPELRQAFATPEDFCAAYHKKNDELWTLYHAGRIGRDYLKTERFEALLREPLGVKAREVSVRLDRVYLDRLAECRRTLDGAHEVLAKLSRHYLIGILSNGFIDTQYAKLRNSGLDRYVQRMVVSDEIGVQKPSPRLFAHALSETGAEASTALMIGDNPEVDIAGAIGAGWRAVYLDRKGKPCAACDARIGSLAELSALLPLSR